jgi:hypothetical protein
MQFCKDCGTVLNLFGNNERELCSSCVQHIKKAEPPPAPLGTSGPAASTADSFELLADAVLSYENNKIVLRSKEGWELWSGTSETQVDLKTILTRAKRIYEIRLRRLKN